MDSVTGMTLTPSSPIIGTEFSATLTVNNVGATWYPASTTWTYTVSYGGMTTAPASVAGQTQVLSATIQDPTPGTYTVTAVTSYASTNYSVAPPDPTTTTATVAIASPTIVAKKGGRYAPAGFQSFITVTDTVSSSAGRVGPYIAGQVQENILQYNGYDKTIYPGTNGWYPQLGGSSASFYLANGLLNDQMGSAIQFNYAPALWNAIPIGTAFITYTQDLQYTWVMSGYLGGTFQDKVFSVPLGSLSWSWVKVSATTWEVQ